MPAARRAFAAAHPEASGDYTRRSRALYPEKVAARKVVERAIENGSLLREPCVTCGKEKAEAHHADYSKPLDVIWYCRQHHADAHRVTGQVESPHPADPLPADVAADLVAGRLSQRCEPCGITEAAGAYCTFCLRETGPDDWFRGTSRRAQGEASRVRAHSIAETGTTALEMAPPEPPA